MNSTIEELANNSQVFLLRHATTDINLVTQRLASSNASKEECVAEWFNAKYRDWGLADVGIEECEKASDIAKSLTIHTVFVSPLIRSIQTAYHLFKDHPNFDSIKFVIVPKAREEFLCTDDTKIANYSLIYII